MINCKAMISTQGTYVAKVEPNEGADCIGRITQKQDVTIASRVGKFPRHNPPKKSRGSDPSLRTPHRAYGTEYPTAQRASTAHTDRSSLSRVWRALPQAGDRLGQCLGG